MDKLDVAFMLSFISLLQVAQHVSGNHVPSSGADDCVMSSPRVGIVPWLQEGCQDRLAGSVFIEEFVALLFFLVIIILVYLSLTVSSVCSLHVYKRFFH